MTTNETSPASPPIPTSLQRLDDGRIEIGWSDGSRRLLTARELRHACPCASCREKREATAPATLLPVLKPEETLPLTVTGMKPVGQYAYSIGFSDGHDTGIYLFDYLHGLGSLSVRSESQGF